MVQAGPCVPIQLGLVHARFWIDLAGSIQTFSDDFTSEHSESTPTSVHGKTPRLFLARPTVCQQTCTISSTNKLVSGHSTGLAYTPRSTGESSGFGGHPTIWCVPCQAYAYDGLIWGAVSSFDSLFAGSHASSNWMMIRHVES